MYKPQGYDQAIPRTRISNFPIPGAYILGIVNAEEKISKGGNQMLVLSLDIAEGNFKNFYSKFSKECGKNRILKHYRLLDNENAAEYLKGDIQAIENSNTNFKFEFDENKLIGKFVGAMLAEEEYLKQDQTIGTVLKIKYLCSVYDARSGKLTIPEKKKINTSFESADFNNRQQNSGKMPWDD